MRLIYLGQGPRAGMWQTAVAQHPKLSPVGRVGGDENDLNLPVFANLQAALDGVNPEAALVFGDGAPELAATALNEGLVVLLANLESLTAAQLSRLRQADQGNGRRCLWLQSNRYHRCAAILGRYLNSGRLGAIGHVSITDRRELPTVAAPNQWLAVGAGQIAAASRLFGMEPTSVMARFSGEGQSVTEVFVELQRQVRVQYFGSASTGSAEHNLWIEGANGSLRTDGRTVWWRKRGWRFFAPVQAGFRSPEQNPPMLLNAALAELHAGNGPGPESWTDMALAAAGFESDRRRVSVEVGALTRGTEG